jgi:hypothetical protein
MGNSERGSNHGAQTPEAVAAHRPSADLLGVLRGFRVEWDDGSAGTAGAMAIFVRTAGFGSGHQKLELLTVDDLVLILPEELRILARTRRTPADVLGNALAHGVRRGVVRDFLPIQALVGSSPLGSGKRRCPTGLRRTKTPARRQDRTITGETYSVRLN